MLADSSPVIRDFAELWQASDKIVYSRTLESVSAARTRIEREFEPDAVRELKEKRRPDLSVGGARSWPRRRSRTGSSTSATCSSTRSSSAGHARAARGLWLELELRGERRFGGGVVHLALPDRD